MVQLIDVAYGNAGRGGAGAVQRARLPRGVPLPSFEGETMLHVCRCHEYDGYEPHVQVSALRVRDGVAEISRWLHLRWRTEGLELFRAPSAPSWKRASPVAVRPERWIRVLWNEHRGDFDVRWSGDVTVNIGLFADRPRPSIFAGEPPALLDLRRDLLRKRRRAR